MPNHATNFLMTKDEFAPEITRAAGGLEVLRRLNQEAPDTWEAFLLRIRAEELSLYQACDELLILTRLKERWRRVGLVPYQHQLSTVRRALGEMRGRVILADEVGLGKTIEAGMILKEYMLRGLVKKALILTPASLCRQWAAELSQKFEIYPVLSRGNFDWRRYEVVVASIDTAKQPQNRQQLQEIYYDLVVVDEAHKLKNPATQNRQLLSCIRKKFFLLLTATPLQNDLKELFYLISLLRPGQLGSYRSFRRHFMQDKRVAKNHEELRNLLKEVMIRNKRGPQISLPPRRVATLPFTPSPEEREFYQAVTDFVRKEYRKGEKAAVNPLTLLTLQREVCSSSFAAAKTLFRLLEKTCLKNSAAEAPGPAFRHLSPFTVAGANNSLGEQEKILRLMEMAKRLKENAKMNLVEEILRQMSGEKVLIFTEFLATQKYIESRLKRQGISALTFDGSLSASKKDFTLGRFREDPRYQALVCTESGGEGINLQFCRVMINYDLPWNPMRLEQRIGRIHRLGQTRETYIYNLVSQGTIEERLLRLLEEKLRLFEVVIGDLQRIIDYFGKGRSFEYRIMKALAEAETEKDLDHRLADLGEEMVGSMQTRDEIAIDQLLFEDRDES